MKENPNNANFIGKRRKKKAFSGNHQRGWMWGHHAVTETLQTGAWPVKEIYATQSAFEANSALLLEKQDSGIPFELVNSDRLQQLCGSSEHQGLVARMGSYPYQSFETLSAKIKKELWCEPNENGEVVERKNVSGLGFATPLVVIADRLQDPFNFGAVLRCCDGANVLGVVVGETGQAEVTPHVARSSSGAINHLAITRVTDLAATAVELQRLGFRLVAADSNTQSNVWNSDLTGPTALVIGSEATGIQQALLDICDQRVNIPMEGKVSSLNVAVAAGILLYEIRRQQCQPSP